MRINLTKKQYEILAKSSYLGNWMANAHRTGRKDDPYIEEFNKINDYIFSFSEQFGLPKNFEEDFESFEDNPEQIYLHNFIDEYDEATFWGELSDRLGERDFLRKYSAEERSKMNQEEHFEKLMNCIIGWEDEIDQNGIERIEVSKLPWAKSPRGHNSKSLSCGISLFLPWFFM